MCDFSRNLGVKFSQLLTMYEQKKGKEEKSHTVFILAIASEKQGWNINADLIIVIV